MKKIGESLQVNGSFLDDIRKWYWRTSYSCIQAIMLWGEWRREEKEGREK